MAHKRNPFLLLFLLAFLLSSCEFGQHSQIKIDFLPTDTTTLLQKIIERDTLIAVTENNLVNYYIYNGQPAGFQYDLLTDLCNSLGVKLELRLSDDRDKCFQMLKDGKVDIIATGLTITKDRKRKYFFSNPILIKRVVLVQQLPKNWRNMSTSDEVQNQLLRSTLELAGQTVHVPKGSHFVTRLQSLSEEIGDTIYIVEEDSISVEGLIAKVNNGEIAYTLADEHIAKITSRLYSDIDIKMPVSLDQQIGWAMEKGEDSSLYLAVNDWLIDLKHQAKSKHIYDKYFKSNNGIFVSNDNRNSMVSGRISIYDDEIKKVAQGIHWDWKLLASLICQESKFMPDVSSTKGAYGLMQLMPIVMEQYEIDSASSPEEQIVVGGKLINSINKQLPESITDSTERIKFILAAYNSGLGHVLDARRLANKYGKNPDIWTDNVDFYMQNKSNPLYYTDSVCFNGYSRGSETYDFVEQVMNRYYHYQVLMKEQKP